MVSLKSSRASAHLSARVRMLGLVAILLSTALFAFNASGDHALALTFTVNSFADGVDAAPGNGSCATSAGNCTLRAAVMEANANGTGVDTIDLSAGTYQLTIAGAGENLAATGDLDITGTLRIVGAGASLTTIDANLLDRAFHALPGSTVIVYSLTVTRGVVTNADGGAALNEGTLLEFNDSAFTNNQANGASAVGGAVYGATGTTNIVGSTFTGNAVSTLGGGGIATGGGATLTVSTSTFIGNSGGFGGGAIYPNGPTTRISSSYFQGNVAPTGPGGAIHSNGAFVVISNSTFYNNTGADSGAIDTRAGNLSVVNSTLVGNSSTTPGGGSVGNQDPQGGVTTVSNSILYGASTANCRGNINTAGFNLTWPSGANCPGTNVNPLVAAAPANNGGPTLTFALLNGSPAIDTGGGSICSGIDVNNLDQRGVTRPTDGDGNGTASCDIGAFEAPAPPPTSTVVTTTADSGAGSLRDAILAANASAAADTISFAIPGAGPHTISPTTALPVITGANTTIDGTTQSGAVCGFGGGLKVALSGASAGAGVNGLTVRGNNVTIRGLVINGFQDDAVQQGGAEPHEGHAIYADGQGGEFANNVLIECNYVGTDYTGNSSVANTGGGPLLHQVVGGTVRNNLLSGNYAGPAVTQSGSGVTVITSDGVSIKGNRIGTNAAGTAALTNGTTGVRLVTTTNVTVGGTVGLTPGGACTGDCNLISGNTSASGMLISLGTAGTVIQGNLVGTDVTGTLDLGNSGSGITFIDATGSPLVKGNVVSGNGGDGIFVLRTVGARIEGNIAGLNAAGNAAIPNTNSGIYVAGSTNTTVGGATAAQRNVVSGNTGFAGIAVCDNTGFCGGVTPALLSPGSGTVIQGNYVGTDVTGTVTLGNAGRGISLDATSGASVKGNVVAGSGIAGVQIFANGSNNTIGGLNAADANTIRDNMGDGVDIRSGMGNRVNRNVIRGNGGIAIDLGNDGGTPNDAGDADTGANNLQNFPTISAFTAGSTLVVASLVDVPPGSYRVEFFAGGACGNAERFLGFTTTPGGSPSFSATLTSAPSASETVMATATDPAGNTSELSPCQVGGVAPGISVGITVTGGNALVAGDTSTPPLAYPGLDSVPITLITPGMVPELSRGLPSTPLNTLPLNTLPLNTLPLNTLPLNTLPLNTLGGSLLDTPLSTFPLIAGVSPLPLDQDTWEERIALTPEGGSGGKLFGVPLYTITIGALAEIAPAAIYGGAFGLQPVTLRNLDLSRSPISGLSLASLLLGGLSLGQIDALLPADLCSTGANCPADTSQTLASAETHGASVKNMPLNTLPLNTLLLTAPLNTLPLNTLPLNTLPLNTLPLNTLPLNTLPLNTLPLGTILSTPLNTLPLNTLAPRLLALYGDGSFCNFSASQGYPCPAGITDASSFSDLVAAIRADTGIGTAPLNTLPLNTLPLNTLPLNTLPLNTLGPSGTPLNTLADLFPSGTDLGSIAPSLGALNFGHILLAILDQGHYPWEEIPFDKISPAELGATRSVAYRVEINAGAYAIPGSTALVTVTLPPGFAYKPGTALFTPNGAAAGTPVAPAVSGKVVSWAISGLTPGDVTDALSFELYTSITLGVAGPGVSVNIGGQTGTATESAAVNVIEFEPDGDVATARAVSPGNVYFTYISTAGDTDLFKFPVSNTGNRVAIYVHNLDNKTDADLGVFTPIDPAVNGAAVRPAPLNTLPINDSNPGAAGASQSLPPDPVNDLSVAVAPLNTLPLNTLGATRQLGGTEQAEVISQDTPGTIYYGKVGLYNGGSSPKALSIRISETPAPPAPVCGAPAFPFPGAPATALSLPGAAPLSTLIVVNLKRIEQFYGAAARADVLARLTTLAAHPQTGGGHILAVDTLTAFAAWDAGNTCDPQLANNVVNQISQHIRTVKAAHPELRHVVIVGDDSVIPFARIADETKTGNEDTFASALADQQSPTFGAFATRNILSDDPYGTTEAISYLNRFLYVPQLSVGRLVETPAEINAQVDLFVSSNGVLDPGSGATPQRALVTGYDFFSDAAVKLIEVVAQRFPLSPRVSLNTPPGTAPAAAWGRQDLLDALYGGAGNAPGLITINGHYDPTQAAPANAYDEKGSPVAGATLISTTDIRDAAKALTRSIVWTMGCHAGTSLHDLITGTEVTLDWAQVYAQRGAAVYVANTGFGYGDSAALSLSEVLMTFFADGLDGTQSAGQALRSAKANYFKTQGQYGEFDYKAMQQTVFYGLPMYRIGTGGLVAQLAAEEGVASQFAAEQVAVTNIPLAPANDPATGLRVAPINVVPNSSVVSTDRGSYYTAGGTPDTLPPVVTGQGAVVIPSVGGAQTTHHRPIEPKVTFEVPGTAPTTTLRAKDALILGLTAQDIQNFDPVIARPSILRGASEPEFTFDQVAFPSQLISTNTYPTNAGVSQHVVVMAGQFFGSGPAGTGTQRVITALNAQLYFGTTGAGQDYVKPQVKTVDASAAGNFATFAVEVEDNAGGADGVRQVYVLFRTASTVAGPVTWTPLNLVRQGTSNRWVGTAPAAGAANVLYYVQAVDASGNVGISFNKGVGHVAGAPQALQQQGLLITTAPAPTPMTPSDSNIFTTPVVVKVAASPANVAVVFTYSVDGGPSLPYSSSGFVVNGPGPHTVVVRGSDGSTGQRGFVIVANPAITILAPKNFALGGNYVAGQVKKANYTCSPSSGASIEICDGTVANGSPIDTSFAGTGPYVEKTFAVTLRDSLNVTLTATVTYRVYANACLVPATISGTTGNDKLKGTPSDDVIRGLGGNDKIEGNGGDDIICTLGGNDEVSAGGGNDVVDAGAGNNNISAGDGDNRVISGAGNDRVNTGSGDDYIDAGAGNNDVRASSGKNKIITGPGNDDIRTGAGDDNIDSGAGNDQIRVGAGNNVVTAGDGNDDVRAGVGNDTLNGGSGTDKCQPGGGTNAITSCEVTLPGNDEDGG